MFASQQCSEWEQNHHNQVVLAGLKTRGCTIKFCQGNHQATLIMVLDLEDPGGEKGVLFGGWGVFGAKVKCCLDLKCLKLCLVS